ncbi:MAG: hypothetical protein AB1422_08095 [bacterium]
MFEHCCKMMNFHINHEDKIIQYWSKFREYVIKIPEVLGGGGLVMNYCPWCGKKLPKSLRDKIFEENQKKGLDLFGCPE